MSSNSKKNETLGMAHGTACSRLRKLVLFHLLCRLEENQCFKCEKDITDVDDLSIEHIEPWEGVSADLFWDISNIAFSHIQCNRPHRLGSPKIKTPDGMAWCSGHQRVFPVDRFYKNSSKDDGLQPYCKDCQSGKDLRRNHAKKI